MKFIQPEIFYEQTHDGLTNGMPFMRIENDTNIPNALFIAAASNFENKNKEVEEEEICDIAIQMYVNSEVLKSVLDEETYDVIRKDLGLLPLKEAQKK